MIPRSFLPRAFAPALVLPVLAFGFVFVPAVAIAQPLASAAPTGVTIDPDKLPDVVAKVNGIEIRKNELLTQTSIVRAQIRRAGGKDPGASKQLLDQVLDGLIGEALMYDDAKKRGLVATEAEVDKGFQGFKANFPDQAAFEASLKSQGSTLEQVRAQLRQSLSIEKVLREEMAKKAEVTKAEAQAFYNQNVAAFVGDPEVKVRLVRVRIEAPGDALARERARQKAEAARRKLLAGEGFAAVVKEYSDDPLTKERGGELPPFSLGGGPVDIAVSKLEVNQFTPVIEAEGGFQVVQLMEKLPVRKISFEEALPRIEGLLEQGKLQNAVLEKVNALRSVAKIEKAI